MSPSRYIIDEMRTRCRGTSHSCQLKDLREQVRKMGDQMVRMDDQVAKLRIDVNRLNVKSGSMR